MKKSLGYLVGLFVGSAVLLAAPAFLPQWRWIPHGSLSIDPSVMKISPDMKWRQEDSYKTVARTISAMFEFKRDHFADTELFSTSPDHQGLAVALTQSRNLVLKIRKWNGHVATQVLASNLESDVNYKLSFHVSDFNHFSFALTPAASTPVFSPNGNTTNNFSLMVEPEGGVRVTELASAPPENRPGATTAFEVKEFSAEIVQERPLWRHFIQPARLLDIFVLIGLFFAMLWQPRLQNIRLSAAEKVKILTRLVVTGLVLSLGFQLMKSYYAGDATSNLFLYIKAAPFTDYLSVRTEQSHLDPYATIGGYPPLAYVLSYPITKLGSVDLEISTLIFIFLCSFFALTRRAFRSVHVPEGAFYAALLTVCSYPVLFMIERGNLDCLIAPLILWAALELHAKRYRRAALILSLPTAMKIIPGIYFGILLVRKRYRDVAVGAFSALLLTLASAAVLKNGIVASLMQMQHNMSTYYVDWTVKDQAVYGGHTLRGLIRILLYNFHRPYVENGPQPWFQTYKISVAALFVALLIFMVRNAALPVWKQFTLLTLATLLFPLFSPDYKLLMLMISALLFIISREYESFDFVYITLFGLSLLQKNFLRLPFPEWENGIADEINAGALLTPIFMVLLGILIVTSARSRVIAGGEGPIQS